MAKTGLASRLGLAVLSTVLTLVLCEMILGLLWPGNDALDLRGLTVRNDRSGHLLAPNTSKVVLGVLNDFQTPLKINSHGFRSPEYEIEPEPGTVRIALFGDSEVFGIGVDEEDMLNARMEELLEGGSGTRYEVLNFAIPGTGTIVHGRLLEQIALDWDLDAAVFVVTVANDLSDNVHFTNRGTSAPKPRKKANPILRRVRALNLYRLAVFKVLPILPGFLTPPASLFGTTPHSVAIWYGNKNLERDFSLMTDTFVRSRDVCATNGVDMYIAAVPSRSQFVPSIVRVTKKTVAPDLLQSIESDPDRPQRMLRSFAVEHGISYVEALYEFRALAEGGARLRHPNDGHLNAEGTYELARILVEGIRDDLESRV